MQINELVTFAADVGRGLLESGAETSRVEDTVERIIRHFYDGKSEVLVVMTLSAMLQKRSEFADGL